MTRKDFRKLLATRERPFVDCCIHGIPSDTDPSFYLSGSQLFAAAAQGLPIPQPPLVQEYNGVCADDLTPVDKLYGDKFEKMQFGKSFLQETDSKVLTLKNQIENEK